MELRDPSTMTAEEIRAEQEGIYNRNLDVPMTREEGDRVNACADELKHRAEAAADEVGSVVEAEPSGDEVDEATTEHPVEEQPADDGVRGALGGGGQSRAGPAAHGVDGARGQRVG
jgi:hypothetical protein